MRNEFVPYLKSARRQAPSPRPRPRAKRKLPPEVLTDAEVRSLMAACAGPPLTAARNRALVALLYRTGLRIGEALAIEAKDVDLASGTIAVLHAKGGSWRVVGVDAGALAVLAEWTALRGRLGVGPRSPLFCTTRGGPVSCGYTRRLMRSLGRAAGIHKRVHAHGLRHTLAAQLRAEGVDIGIISRQLGHRSIATTARYLDHIAPVDVVRAMRGREWGPAQTSNAVR